MKTRLLGAAALAAPLALAHPAFAAPAAFGDPVKVSDDVTIDPILDARLRWENVDTPTKDADAVTLRLRGGFEVKHTPSHLSLLAEAEGTLALGENYNGLGFVPGKARPAYAAVPDPANVELNRLQIQYRTKQAGLTIGRQRINLDDQRWVGSVGWRQNEQTFDAARAEVSVGPVMVDATYADSQRTIFGVDAGPRTAYDGNFLFLQAGVKHGPVSVKGFAYLLDYDAKEQVGPLAVTLADTQTYGVRAVAALPLSKAVKLNLAASYAHQSAYKDNPAKFGAEYLAGEAGLAARGWTLTGGYERLGTDKGIALQTPMATLHKFNGWADLFLTTPAAGLEDAYVGLAKALPKLNGLTANVTWHTFHSEAGHIHYGDEWDASIGLKVRKVALLAKYADYSAKGFGADTRKFWLEADYAF
ncbi:alginate export family protein [Novosphingobium sp. KCTC 2891]|uniref:alginate export family protein n=1 Tax=Novosphingobium sp. KCTC 2891 TaxID=2989730 RepID=UPI0022236236|nr:alginate export family protein [Novosphingobium sp. KCTC 2891]MCW1382885.1 alginate export family protein [Novosphingobium sp. KCTC 2891]